MSEEMRGLRNRLHAEKNELYRLIGLASTLREKVRLEGQLDGVLLALRATEEYM